MAKNWKIVRSDRENEMALSKMESVAKARKAVKAIRCVETKSYENLKKEGIDAHAAIVAREDKILAGKEANLLQSESLKKEAIAIEKRRNAKNEKKGKAVDKAE